MTEPAQAAGWFAAAWLYGMGLGVLYGFLRPLRPRLTTLADLVFSAAAIWAWLVLSFGICGGDLRLSCTMGLAAGGVFWELTAGRLLRPVFFGFWRGVGRVFGWITRPVKDLLKIFRNFIKKVLHIGKKWVTIGWNRCCLRQQKKGMWGHGKKRKDKAGIPVRK